MFRRVLIVAPTEGFIIKGLETKLKNIGVESVYSSPKMKDLDGKLNEIDLVMFYTDEKVEEYATGLVYIKDMCAELDEKVAVIGTRLEFDTVKGYIPDKALEPVPAGQFLFPGDLDTPLLDALLREDDLSLFSDVSKDLAERIKNNLSEYNGFEAFAEQLKTKNFTRARINRALLHVLLNIREDSEHLKELSDTLTHVRVLGFKKKSKDILKDIKTKGSIVPVTKIPDIYDDADPVMKRMLDSELYASTLYDRLLSLKYDIKIPQEYSKPCIMI